MHHPSFAHAGCFFLTVVSNSRESIKTQTSIILLQRSSCHNGGQALVNLRTDIKYWKQVMDITESTSDDINTVMVKEIVILSFSSKFGSCQQILKTQKWLRRLYVVIFLALRLRELASDTPSSLFASNRSLWKILNVCVSVCVSVYLCFIKTSHINYFVFERSEITFCLNKWPNHKLWRMLYLARSRFSGLPRYCGVSPWLSTYGLCT